MDVAWLDSSSVLTTALGSLVRYLRRMGCGRLACLNHLWWGPAARAVGAVLVAALTPAVGLRNKVASVTLVSGLGLLCVGRSWCIVISARLV